MPVSVAECSSFDMLAVLDSFVELGVWQCLQICYGKLFSTHKHKMLQIWQLQ